MYNNLYNQALETLSRNVNIARTAATTKLLVLMAVKLDFGENYVETTVLKIACRV